MLFVYHKLNPNKCCIEIISTQELRIILYQVEPKQVLYWNAYLELNIASNVLVEPKQVLYWNFVLYPAGTTILLVEPKQVLYWNREIKAINKASGRVEPKQVLYWNLSSAFLVSFTYSLNPNKCCIEINRQKGYRDKRFRWTQTSVVLK